MNKNWWIVMALVGTFISGWMICSAAQSVSPDPTFYSWVMCRKFETNTPHTDLCKLVLPTFTLKECLKLKKERDEPKDSVYSICVVEPHRMGR